MGKSWCFHGWLSIMGMVVLSGIHHPVFSQGMPDTIQPEIWNIRQQITGIEERITTAENSLEKLTKIRISGYIQAQWEYNENPAIYPNNSFLLRRARFKIKYEPYSGVAFVLEPDFTLQSVTIKDVYVRLNEPWLNTFSLWAGQFKKLNYEVETSSSQLDVLTRSYVVSALYPGERGVGAKIDITPPFRPYQVELAVFNGNENLVIVDAEGNNINPKKTDFDPFKDIMGRFVYHFRLGNAGGLDAGASGYYGWMKSNSTTLLYSDYSMHKTVSAGQSISRGWFGVEMRCYVDFLGGIALKAEYMRGVNVFPGYLGSSSVIAPATIFFHSDTLMINTETSTATNISPTIRRNFQGWYIYLVKNIGKKHKLAIRWDYYDPNTSLTGNNIGITAFNRKESDQQIQSDISGTNPVIAVNTIQTSDTKNSLKSGLNDLAYQRVSFCWSYFVTDNITIQLAYDIPLNEKVGVNAAGEGNVRKTYLVNDAVVVNDYSRIFPQNILTLQLQAKF